MFKESKAIRYIVLLFCLGALLYSSHNLITFFIDNNRSINLTTELRENIINDDNDIDFTSLIEKNSDTVGWILFNNELVNYPIVQTLNNDLYLHTGFNGNINSLGAIFMDYRNDNFRDRNTVIYGHNTPNNTMFGSLSDALEEDFFDNEDNNFINIITPSEIMRWQIFSVYNYIAEEYYITTTFDSDNSFESFIDTISNRSVHNFNIDLSIYDRILTLSTCYGTGNTDWRTVIHAKLVVD